MAQVAGRRPEGYWRPGGRTVGVMGWDLRHRRSSFVIRLVLAVWIAVVVVVLCATGRWWGLIFVVPLLLDLYLLRRIVAAGHP
jgi:polyferredoxin